MALDDLARDVQALDAVGIDGALGKPADCTLLTSHGRRGIDDGFCLGIKHLDKVAANNLALLFRVGDAGEIGEELGTGIDTHDIETKALIVVHHLTELILAQHAVVDKDTRQAGADGTMEQHGGNGGIDTSREAEDDTVVPQLLLEFGHGGVDERGCTPLLTGAADADHEIAEQECALKGVEHLGVELYGPDIPGVPEGGIRHVLGASDDLKAVGDGGDSIAMRHPYLGVFLEASEKRIGDVDRLKVCPSVLTAVGLLDLSTECVGDKLCTVADAQHGNASHELREVDLEGIGVVDGIG